VFDFLNRKKLRKRNRIVWQAIFSLRNGSVKGFVLLILFAEVLADRFPMARCLYFFGLAYWFFLRWPGAFISPDALAGGSPAATFFSCAPRKEGKRRGSTATSDAPVAHPPPVHSGLTAEAGLTG
jgi:hypothetical protein